MICYSMSFPISIYVPFHLIKGYAGYIVYAVFKVRWA